MYLHKEIRLTLITLSIVVILISGASSSLAQTEISLSALADTTIYTYATVMPEFPGGEAAMIKFIKSNFRHTYTYSNTEQPIQTKTLVEYVVEKDGTISNVKEYKTEKNGVITQELIRVVKMFPKYTPAKTGDKFVRVRLIVPLNIDLK